MLRMPDELNLPPEESPSPQQAPVAFTNPAFDEAPEPQWAPGRENPPWTGWDVLTIFFAFFVAVFLFGGIAMGVALHSTLGQGVKPAELARDPRVLIPAQLAAYLAVVLFMFFVVRSHALRFLRAVRWNFPYRRAVSWVAVGAALAFLIQMTSAWLPVPKSLPIEEYFRNATGAWLMTLFGVSMAPFVEELLFRGFLYPALTRTLGMAASVALTSAGFALMHEAQLARAWAPLLLVFVVGLVLTLVRARTGSVAAGFLVHAGYNATLFVMLYIGSDGFRHLEKMGQ